MQQLLPQAGQKFPISMPAGTQAGDHYLHFTTTLFDISYYSTTPKQYTTLVNQGKFKVYFAAIGHIPFISIQTPLGRLYFTPNFMQLTDDEFYGWIAERKSTTAQTTFYLLDMKNTIIASHRIPIVGHLDVYEAAERMREKFENSYQVECETEAILNSYASPTLQSKFRQIG